MNLEGNVSIQCDRICNTVTEVPKLQISMPVKIIFFFYYVTELKTHCNFIIHYNKSIRLRHSNAKHVPRGLISNFEIS